MTEVLFYHLERQPLERVLPLLLEKSLERGWSAVVQAGTAERVAALDSHLWSYRDDSFLAHGTMREDDRDRQPVYLTAGDDNPNGAAVRFFVDDADMDDISAYERCVYLFSGADGDAVARARAQWKRLAGAGHEVTYWRQNENGGWEKKA